MLTDIAPFGELGINIVHSFVVAFFSTTSASLCTSSMLLKFNDTSIVSLNFAITRGRPTSHVLGERVEVVVHDFMKHFPAEPTEFSLKTNTGCSWRVMMKVIHNRVTLDQGWATFVAVCQVRIGCVVISKLLTPNTMKVIVFNDEGMEVVTKCKKHDNAFGVRA
ncbi:Speckle-type POZ protein [Hordeum vulgare]|nr:Speckle-type POZ protein [Hordeum vulgare]